MSVNLEVPDEPILKAPDVIVPVNSKLPDTVIPVLDVPSFCTLLCLNPTPAFSTY